MTEEPHPLTHQVYACLWSLEISPSKLQYLKDKALDEIDRRLKTLDKTIKFLKSKRGKDIFAYEWLLGEIKGMLAE